MGTNTMPRTKRVTLDEAKGTGRQIYGYSHKLFDEILAAYKNNSEAVCTEFPSVSAANKMVGQLALHAEQAGLDLYSRREHKTSIRYFWLEPKPEPEPEAQAGPESTSESEVFQNSI